MISPDDWNSGKFTITFINEVSPSGKQMPVRKFSQMRKDATGQQILQFGKAISMLTPNGADGNVKANADEHFEIFDIPEE